MSHRSVFEIQTQCASSSSDDMSPERHTPPRWHSQNPLSASALIDEECSTAVAGAAEMGMELQEQGHAEMLQHALGESLA